MLTEVHMNLLVKFVPLVTLLTSVSFGQAGVNAQPGSTVEMAAPNVVSPQQSDAGDFVASTFFPAWQHQSFAAYPKQTPQRTAPAAKPRPRMEGSATGYIDNAIVGSQIRFRFDAAFGFQDPDRAEFFYAKCGCYRTSYSREMPALRSQRPWPRRRNRYEAELPGSAPECRVRSDSAPIVLR